MPINSLIRAVAIAFALLYKIGAVAAETSVFSTDFNTVVPPQISGVTTTEGVQGFSGLGPAENQFSGSFLRNSTGGSPVGSPSSLTTLTLSDLPVHTSVNLSFLLATLESWDGSGTNVFQGDFFNVVIGDGVTNHLIFSETFGRPEAGPQSYVPPPGVLLSTGTDLGSFGIVATDSAYNMGVDATFQNVAHTSSTLVVSWFANGPGYQGGTDESWAIDNVRVTVNSVPEPETAFLLLNGLLILSLAIKARN